MLLLQVLVHNRDPCVHSFQDNISISHQHQEANEVKALHFSWRLSESLKFVVWGGEYDGSFEVCN